MKYKNLIPLATFVIVFFAHVLYFMTFVVPSPHWWKFYVLMEQYHIGFSLGLAFAFGAYAFATMRGRSKATVAGSAVVAGLVWFTSCCGAPMLAVVFGILGIGVAGAHLPPPLMTLVTIGFVSLGFAWFRRRKVGAKLVCESCGLEMDVPVVHCGPGIPGPEEGKLYCPCLPEGHTENIDMPIHCGKPMKYVK